MSNINDPLDWVTKAEGDYTLARSALRRKLPITFGACFHAQQCAEKYMKAMLVARKQRFSKIHDLAVLNKQCEDNGIFIGVSKVDLQMLAFYAVETRYPGAEPSVEDSQVATKIASAVRKFARKYLNVK
jgi:HEPN domain-containing protein